MTVPVILNRAIISKSAIAKRKSVSTGKKSCRNIRAIDHPFDCSVDCSVTVLFVLSKVI